MPVTARRIVVYLKVHIPILCTLFHKINEKTPFSRGNWVVIVGSCGMIFYEKTIGGSTERCGTYFGIYLAIDIGLDL